MGPIGLKTSRKELWLVNPWVDSLFLLSAIFIYALFSWMLRKNYFEDINVLLVAGVLFSYSHSLGPLLILIKDSSLRQETKAKYPYYILVCSALLLIPLIAYSYSAYMFKLDEGGKLFYVPILAVALIYLGWSFWHMMAQQFGILRMYKNKYGNVCKNDRDNDFLFCAISLVFVCGAIFLDSWRQDNVSLIKIMAVKIPWDIKVYFAFFPALMLLYAIGYMLYYRIRSLPVFLCYMGIIATVASVIFFPSGQKILLFTPIHWLQATFLTALVATKRAQVTRSQRKTSLLRNLGVFIAIGAVVYSLRHIPFFEKHQIKPRGDLINIEGLTGDQFLIVALFFSVFIGLDFVHFYLDRLAYKTGGTHREILVPSRAA